MRALIQRVDHASVTVEGSCVGKIEKGLLVLLGVGPNDSEKEADFLAEKCANLRIFTDENDKMNLSLLDIGGQMLVVSQFTSMRTAKGTQTFLRRRGSTCRGKPLNISSRASAMPALAWWRWHLWRPHGCPVAQQRPGDHHAGYR